jgi:hypothetical protein
MWQWPAPTMAENAPESMHSYLRIAQPLVVLAYGRDSTFFCLSKLTHLAGCPNGIALTEFVGLPRMMESDLIGATIVIPGFHPGHTKTTLVAEVYFAACSMP